MTPSKTSNLEEYMLKIMELLSDQSEIIGKLEERIETLEHQLGCLQEEAGK